MEEKNYFDRNLTDREKMVYYFEKHKEAKKCNRPAEASKFLHLANHYFKQSQIIKEDEKSE